MIFIGRDLADLRAHFVTNIVNSIGTNDDLVVDLREIQDWRKIAALIDEHCARIHEQFVVYNAYTDESLPLNFKRDFPDLTLITFFSDDEWRHENYNRYLALFTDIFTVAVKANVARYRAYGLEHVHYMRWGCNPELFHPVPGLEQVYDVTFIGAAYGKRIEYIRGLLQSGIKLNVFGPGWERYGDVKEHWGGVLSYQDMIRVISQSKISLNFLWTSRGDGSTTIKGRTLELAACRAFQLSNHTGEFSNYGFIPGDNIAIFEDKNDLLVKIRHYLNNPVERNNIADAAYQHVLEKLTWQVEFADLFQRARCREFQPPTLPRFKILVIVADGVQHDIHVDDPRLAITLSKDNAHIPDFSIYHGVIRLSHDSTINNDTLYMMAFGMHADQADGILANFYLGKRWIRFRDNTIRQKRSLAAILPPDCFMASGRGSNMQCSPQITGKNNKMAFVEYPSFSIVLPFLHARLLRLFFCDHDDARERIRRAIQSWKLRDLVSIIIDRLWQKIILGV